MRALVTYFSITGTTRRVADSIAEGLGASGADVVLHDLRAGAPSDPTGFDIVGVGSPVHWYRLPPPVREAVRGLGDLAGRSVFAFTLNATYRGAALDRLRAALRRAGGREIGVFSCRGEGRFLGYTRLGVQFSPGHPTDAELDAAFEFGRSLPAAHAAAWCGEPAPETPPDPPTHWVYALERALVTPWSGHHIYSRFFRADPVRCTRCGKCARICPTRNIAWEKDRLPTWGRDCIVCLTCAEVCPEAAVRSPVDWPVFRPLLRYNVARAGRDPGIEHVRVELRRGKVMRLQTTGPDARKRWT